jgi:hypothetical protein
MASFIVYVRNNKIELLNKWLSDPDYNNDSFTQEDVKLYMEEKEPEFAMMMINHREFVLLNDFIESKTQTDFKGVINRKAILREYLKRIGAEPSKVFSVGSAAIDEVLQIGIDIIEETYSVKEKC